MIAATTEITPMTQGFLSAPRKMLIDGQWGGALSEHTFSTFNPATGDVLCQVPAGQKADIAIARSRRRGTRLSRDHGER